MFKSQVWLKDTNGLAQEWEHVHSLMNFER